MQKNKGAKIMNIVIKLEDVIILTDKIVIKKSL